MAILTVRMFMDIYLLIFEFYGYFWCSIRYSSFMCRSLGWILGSMVVNMFASVVLTSLLYRVSRCC